MAKKFKDFVQRPKPRKRPGKHKKRMNKMSQDLRLNNGEVATYKFTDFWSRPHYDIKAPSGALIEVCCVDLDGTNLHTLSEAGEDGEPDSPLKQEYQPVQKEGL